MADYKLTNENVNSFFLNILADSVLIVRNALSPQEHQETAAANTLANRLDALADSAGKSATQEKNKQAFTAAQDARRFFLHILNRTLTETFHMDLKQTSLGLFATEAEHYMDILNTFMQGRIPVYDPLQEEIKRLPVFSIQSRYIADNINYFEIRNRQRAEELSEVLNKYWTYSYDLQMMERAGQGYRVIADEHHESVAEVLREYFEFLTSLIHLLQEHRITGSLSLLFLDRSRRMVCFYLMNWANSVNATPPDCDPYAKRLSEF